VRRLSLCQRAGAVGCGPVNGASSAVRLSATENEGKGECVDLRLGPLHAVRLYLCCVAGGLYSPCEHLSLFTKVTRAEIVSNGQGNERRLFDGLSAVQSKIT
jgi:hypothetical protein